MPEMPEIETIRRSLEPHIQGKKISEVNVLLPRQIKWPTPEKFVDRIIDTNIVALNRRGKYLLLCLDNGITIIFHLRMTGQLMYIPQGQSTKESHMRLEIKLSQGDRLVFCDTRTFGTIYAMEPEEINDLKGLAEMGPEPLSQEFTPAYLTKAVANKKTRIKSFLLNQAYIAGLGNIYVDEALFLAGVHPMRLAGSLQKDEILALYGTINEVIKAGIDDGGTTFRDYRNGEGGKGSHQDNLYAYGRDGLPCKKCGTVLEKIKVGGRGTHFCPQCQKNNSEQV